MIIIIMCVYTHTHVTRSRPARRDVNGNNNLTGPEKGNRERGSRKRLHI